MMYVCKTYRLHSLSTEQGWLEKTVKLIRVIFDISFFSNIPNMTIIAPKNGRELEKALEFAQKYNGPIAIRFSRGKASNVFENLNNELVMAKAKR